MSMVDRTTQCLRNCCLALRPVAWIGVVGLLGALVSQTLAATERLAEITEQQYWSHQIETTRRLSNDLSSLRRDVERIRSLLEKDRGK